MVNKSLSHFVELFSQDRDIADLEQIEGQYKDALRDMVDGGVDQATALKIANTQKEIGLLYKHKPYGVKACTPLGYSIFILNPGQGFSFQNHLTTKIEIFHFLSKPENGFAFLSEYEDWLVHHREDRIDSWLAGQPDSFYDQHKIVPGAGDVVSIEKTGLVHTALGCVLEEYANTSTDMVQRLYDQNTNRDSFSVPSGEHVAKEISDLVFPDQSFRIEKKYPDVQRQPLAVEKASFGQRIVLADNSEFRAERLFVQSAGEHVLDLSQSYASLCVTSGTARIGLGSDLVLQKGDCTLLTPGFQWVIKNKSEEELSISLLMVPKSKALQ